MSLYVRAQQVLYWSLATIAALLFLTASDAASQDKSGSRANLTQLPSPGGTVVSERGQFTLNRARGEVGFTIPFPLLPDRAGGSPKISFEYNQRNGESGAGFGIGWRLNVPSIVNSGNQGILRINSQKWAPPGVQLSLSGKRLIYMGQIENQHRFRMRESENDFSITYFDHPYTVSHGRSVGGNLPSIETGFEVVNPDGSRMLFSGNRLTSEGDTEIVTRYPLVFEVLPNGESIAYLYRKIEGVSYLSEIVFAGGKSRYRFDLAEVGLARVSYAKGTRKRHGQLYTRMIAEYDGDIHAQWCFAYEHGASAISGHVALVTHERCSEPASRTTTGRDSELSEVSYRLRTLFRFGNQDQLATNSQQLSPVHFEYSNLNFDPRPQRELIYRMPELLQAGGHRPSDYELADVDFDGLVDIIKRTEHGETLFYGGQGNLAKGFTNRKPWVLVRGSQSIAPDLNSDRFHFADLNGDTLADLVEFSVDEAHVFWGSEEGHHSRAFRLPDGLLRQISSQVFASGRGQFIDLNRDGRTDILSTYLDGTGNTAWRAFVNNTENNEVSFERRDYTFPWASQAIDILDRSDFKLADVNGDQLPDLLVHARERNGLCVYPNVGALFKGPPNRSLFGGPQSGGNDVRCRGAGTFVELPDFPQRQDLSSAWMIDVNGDGVMDVVTFGERFSQLLVWFGVGDFERFLGPQLLDTGFTGPVSSANSGRFRVADIDGDGQAEIVAIQNTPKRSDRAIVLDFNRTGHDQMLKPGLLTSVRYESGLRYEFRYATWNDERIRDKRLSPGTDVPTVHFPIIVVKQLVESFGPRDISGRAPVVTEMFYRSPQFDLLDREFKGFTEVDLFRHGDEYRGAASTQASLLSREIYHSSSVDGATRALVGKLIARREYSVLADDTTLLRTEVSATHSVSGSSHSLSQETQRGARPVLGALLRELRVSWQAIEREGGTWYARKVGDETIERASDVSRKLGSDALLISTDYLEYDNHNISHQQVGKISEQTGFGDIVAPAYERVHTQVFENARQTLASLGIINKPSKTTVKVEGESLSELEYEYYPESGLTKSLTEKRFSRLSVVPNEIKSRFSSEVVHTTLFVYDSFGNPTTVSDDMGSIEEVRYGEDGIFPIEHRLANHSFPENTRQRDTDLVLKLRFGPQPEEMNIAKGRLASYTTHLGLTQRISYDHLGRRSKITGDDGSEQIYRYRIGAEGAPTLIMTSFRRHSSATEVPEGEALWVDVIDAYQPDGTLLAKLENDQSGSRVRVVDRQDFNRNRKVIFRWTPYFMEQVDTQHAKAVGHIDESCEAAQDFDVCAAFKSGVITAPQGNWQNGHLFKYDSLERVALQVLPSGKRIQVTYFPWGTETTATYSDIFDDEVMQVRYDIETPVGLYGILETSAPEENTDHVTRFERDLAGHLSAIWLPGAQEPRRFLFNSAGMLERQTIPGLGERYYIHDIRGREITRLSKNEEGNAELIITEFDLLDRPRRILANGDIAFEMIFDEQSTSLSTSPNYTMPLVKPIGELVESVSYDPHGRKPHRRIFGYDRQARVIHEEVTLSNEAYAVSNTYTLDGVLNRTRNSFGVESIRSFGRSAHIKSISVSSAATPDEKIIEDIVYNERGQLEKIEYRAGAQTSVSYDPATLLVDRIYSTYTDSSGTVQPIQDLNLTINQNGSINAISDEVPNDAPHGHIDRSATFRYNWKDELVESSRFGETHRYKYSAAGAFVENGEYSPHPISKPSSLRSGIIPARNGSKPYSFNGFGQLSSSPQILSTRFDAFGRLIEAKTDIETIHYAYDSGGNRLYVERTKQNGSISESRFPMPGMTIEPEGEESHVLVAGIRIARIEHATGKWFYYLKDFLDSTDILMTSDGVPVEQMLYRPFGSEVDPEVKSSTWKEHRTENSTSLPRTPTKHRFTGHYRDDATRLYYFGARYYDPILGRFISGDSAFLNEPRLCEVKHRECNLYLYALNNPTKLVDPTGEWVNVAIGAGVGIVVGVAMEASVQMMSGQELNPKRLFAAAVGGGASGAVAGATFGTSLLAQGSLAVGSSVAGGVATRAVLGERQNGEDVLIDAAIGAATFGLVKGGGRLVQSSFKHSRTAGSSSTTSSLKNGFPQETSGWTKIRDLITLDGSAHRAPRPKLQRLSDAELLSSARNPTDGGFLIKNVRTGRLTEGNGRAIELQRRAADQNSGISFDDRVPVTNHKPDHSMFWDLD